MRFDGEAWTDDAVLGGRLRLLQPRRGHRVGHDAILLAAAVSVAPGDHVVDLGAGVGAVGLALARRVSGVRVSLVEIDPVLAAAAEENARRNAIADVAVRVIDVAAGPDAFARAGLAPGSAHHVAMNPPFREAHRHRASPDPERRRAHLAGPELLSDWLAAAARLLAPGGAVTLILPADRLGDALAALAGDFGSVAVLPVYARANTPAIRVLTTGEKGGRGPLTLAPGLVLEDPDGRPGAAAEAIFRGAEALAVGAGRTGVRSRAPAG